jgi:hypothetical protein
MAKRALCVGINDYPYDGSDLNGCVNDANAWAQLLVDHYDFSKPDVSLLTNAEAAKADILAGLQELLILTKLTKGEVWIDLASKPLNDRYLVAQTRNRLA